MSEKLKILVTGGAGYIGSHVVRKFLDQGCRVTVYDNLSTGSSDNIFKDTLLTFVEGDILDHEKLSAAAEKGFDGIIHLAAFKAAGESMIYPEKYSVNNISGTLSLLNCALKAGIKNIVFSSSAAVYGEPEYIPIDEKHPLNPENYYGFTKLKIEEFLQWYEQLKGISSASLRYFNAAGYDPDLRVTGLEKNPANLLPVIMETAAGTREKIEIFGSDYPTRDGTCIRDYIHVTDLAEAHYLSMVHLAENRGSFRVNLGSEKGSTVLEMLELSRKITDKPIPSALASRRPGDPAILVAGSSRAQKLLGWRPHYSSPELLIQTSWKVYKKRFAL